jgi:CheY-like chemotaxis protein/nitrogen-specific signal transduction histidine kinase
VVIFPIIGVGGKPERFVLMHEDITKRKQVEDALIAAKESAEENNRLKSSFLANMSHELRTPLSGILGFSELLKDQIQEEVKRDMVNMISKSGNRLLNTLNLILDLSQLEANMQKVNLSVFNLNNLLNNIIDLFQPIAYKKGITLSFYPEKQELFLSSDFYMLEHIMNELVSNAIKYTNTGSVVVSSRATYINKESHVIIEVTDTGIGISKDNQQVIFDAFRQVSEGWNRSFEGTGLGLTICKKYVNLLGGELALLSEIDKGSQFTLNFPVEVLKKTEQEVKPNNLPDSISLSPSASATAPVNLPQVLLVDDDTMCNLLVSKMLQDIVNLDYATTGTEGLEFIENTNYAAVLLDINLKTGLSGLDVLARIKENDKHKDIPIIALTAYAMLDDKENLLAQGFTDYISKPFTINILTSTIQKWIKV